MTSCVEVSFFPLIFPRNITPFFMATLCMEVYNFLKLIFLEIRRPKINSNRNIRLDKEGDRGHVHHFHIKEFRNKHKNLFDFDVATEVKKDPKKVAKKKAEKKKAEAEKKRMLMTAESSTAFLTSFIT
ncbi:hypothetical protein L3Y34_019616 [Caenorhabditis briggsae]|uniref:Uncharacterized protein n=1 Tax=Caenorhabditis briggsae TaxID=6238 RepID=A0AAE9IWB6_CAEBR|nr:hypothetical protein L3Y34_019616 [Caenorhabditis briggsae]